MAAKYGKGICAYCGGIRHRKTQKFCSLDCKRNASKADTARRFRARINKTDTCWLWTGPVFPRSGYGKFWAHNTTLGAHRYAYELFVGPVPPGLHVCHRCDVKLCLNPAHLFAGTHTDNMRDKIAKGREEHGDRHWTRRRPDLVARGSAVCGSKLSENDVYEIRQAHASGDTIPALARRFHVSAVSIHKIVRRQTWKHLP